MVIVFHVSVFTLYRLPESEVADRDSKFPSSFWSELMRIFCDRPKLSTDDHPQMDGQSDVMNKTLEHYLRTFSNYNQHDWDTLLATAEVS